MARHQQRPPIPRAHRVGLREGRVLAREHPQQCGGMRREQILPSKVGNDTVLGPALPPDRFDQPDVLVDVAVRAFDFHGAQKHSECLYRVRR